MKFLALICFSCYLFALRSCLANAGKIRPTELFKTYFDLNIDDLIVGFSSAKKTGQS